MVLLTTIAVDASYAARHPESVMVPLTLVVCIALYMHLTSTRIGVCSGAMGHRRRLGVVAAVGLLALALALAAIAPAQPAQLAGTSACVDFLGRDGCQPGHALGGADAIVSSPDGRFVYVGARTVAVFARAADGTLTQLPGAVGCVSEDTRDRPVGPAGACGGARGVLHADALIESPDGHALYVLDVRDAAIAAFARDSASGRLRQLSGLAGCLSASGAGGCARDHRLAGLRAIALTRDGQTMYAVAGDGRVTALARDRDGRLSPLAGPGACLAWHARLGCTGVALLQGAFTVVAGANGRDVYVATDYGDIVEDASVGAVVALTRSASGRLAVRRGPGSCVANVGHGCSRIPDGVVIDLAADRSGQVLWLSRGSTYKGAYTQTSLLGLRVSRTGGLTPGPATAGARGLVFAADGREAYGLGLDESDVLLFRRDPATARLTPPAPPACIDELSVNTAGAADVSACISAHGFDDPVALAISPDSRTLYVASATWNGVAAFAGAGP